MASTVKQARHRGARRHRIRGTQLRPALAFRPRGPRLCTDGVGCRYGNEARTRAITAYRTRSRATGRPPLPPSAPPPRRGSTFKVPTAVALFDYAAQADEELSFSEGDIIEIVTRDASGWWSGRLRNKLGYFPGWRPARFKGGCWARRTPPADCCGPDHQRARHAVGGRHVQAITSRRTCPLASWTGPTIRLVRNHARGAPVRRGVCRPGFSSCAHLSVCACVCEGERRALSAFYFV